MHKSDRIQVTLSPAMRIAITLLAEKTGLAPSTQAMVTLRAALDRTIHSAEGQERLREWRGRMNLAERIYDATTDRYVENLTEREQEKLHELEEEAAATPATDAASRIAARRRSREAHPVD
jgi:hypothetical protein